MSYTYDQRRRPQGQTEPAAEQTAPGPDFSALAAGTAKPDAALKGRPIDLDGAIKAKMENAFGDLSAVKLYESAAVGEAGAEAVAQGNEIAFAPGMADFSSRAGQERLGHELSHVALQRSGAVRGEGFLNDPALEARADREGAMAAAGAQVYSGPVCGALSGAAPSAAVAGPMQAKRGGEKKAPPKANPIEYDDILLDDGEESEQAQAPEYQDNRAEMVAHAKRLGLDNWGPIEYDDVPTDEGYAFWEQAEKSNSAASKQEGKKKPWWKFW